MGHISANITEGEQQAKGRDGYNPKSICRKIERKTEGERGGERERSEREREREGELELELARTRT